MKTKNMDFWNKISHFCSEKSSINLIRLTIVLFLFFLALSYWFDLFKAHSRIDNIFLLIIAAGLLVIFLPWDKLKSIEAGPLKVSLDLQQVNEVIDKLNLDRIVDVKLKTFLDTHSAEIKKLQGSRILWIDDRPDQLVGERRLLRALGFQITTAVSSEMAEVFLMNEPDFDLIITDVQRTGKSYKETNGIDIHEGVNYIVKLYDPSLRNPEIPWKYIKDIPIIFYAAYEDDRLVKFTAPAISVNSRIQICNEVYGFVKNIISSLESYFASPISYPVKKIGTGTREV